MALLATADSEGYTGPIRKVRLKPMANPKLNINLGHVNYSTLRTDDDIQREAQRILPNVILQIGEVIGEVKWNLLQKTIKESIFKTSLPSANKQKFIQQAAQDYKRKISNKEKIDLKNEIIAKLRKSLRN